MKKKMMLIAVISCILLILCGCGGDDLPSEDSLKSAIPKELLSYSIDNTEYPMTVDSFTIIRQRKYETTKTVYTECKVTLKGTYLDREATVGFTSNFYDKGGWQVDYTSIDNDTKAYHDTEPLIKSYIDWLYQDIANQGSYSYISSFGVPSYSKSLNYDIVTGAFNDKLTLRFKKDYKLVCSDATHAEVSFDFESVQFPFFTVNGYVPFNIEIDPRSGKIHSNYNDFVITYDWKDLTGKTINNPTDRLSFETGPEGWSFTVNRINSDGTWNITVNGYVTGGVFDRDMFPFSETFDCKMELFKPDTTWSYDRDFFASLTSINNPHEITVQTYPGSSTKKVEIYAEINAAGGFIKKR